MENPSIKPDKFKNWLSCLLIVISGFVLYGKTINFGFVEYDDYHLIVTNRDFISDIRNVPEAFLRDVFDVKYFKSSKSYYRPLLTVSLMIDAQAGGTSPAFYHLSNILYHAAASCLLYLLLVTLKYPPALSAFMALAFVAHPILSQAVAWIPGRNDSLLAVFVLLSSIFLIKYMETGSLRSYIIHAVSFAAAVFTKETAVGLIAVSILYVLIFHREKNGFKKAAFLAAAWCPVTILWAVMRAGAINNPSITPLHVAESLVTNSPAIVQYLGKIIFPVNLTVYPIMKDMPLTYGIAALILIAVILILSKEKNPRRVTFGALWFLVFLCPSLISARPGETVMLLEHRAYVPMIGIFLILIETGIVSKTKIGLNIRTITGVIVVAGLGFAAYMHSDSMKDPMSYWSDAVSGSPSSAVAHLNLGDKYYSARQLDAAEREFRKAIELDPSQLHAHNNLGRVLAVRGMLKEAEMEFLAEIENHPDNDKALYNLGMVNMDSGKSEIAVEYWKKAVEANPYNINANRMLAMTYLRRGMESEAEKYLRRLQEMGVLRGKM